MLIDSHCHLHDIQFFDANKTAEIITRAHQNDVQKIVCIGTDPEDSLAAHDFAVKNPGIYWTFGIHPEETSKNPALADADLDNFKNSLSQNTDKLVAIGEVGLDYHYEGYNRDAQIKLFNTMLQLAKDANLPISFHIREAFDDFFGVVVNFPEVRGVVHSFTDSKKTLKRILSETDFYIGVNGLATYSTLPMPPLEKILLETDAPFLAPVPYRGTTNEPAYILDIAKWLAQKTNLNLTEISEITTKNATDLFHFQ